MECVTGGSGFIGSVLSKRLSKRFKVRVVDIETPPCNLQVEYVRADVRHYESIKKALKECERVYHLAAITDVAEAQEDPRKAFETNARGTLNVLEASRLYDLELVYASSAAVYGDPLFIPLSEHHPTLPKNVYGASKLSGEALVTSYSRSYGLRAWSLRLFNVYGPSPNIKRNKGVITLFIERALRGEPLTVYGEDLVRDFVFIDDVVRAFLTIKSAPPGVYNVGSGKDTKILELAKIIIDITKSSSEVALAEPREEDIRVSVADIRKISKYWTPKTDLYEGLRVTVEYIKRTRGR